MLAACLFLFCLIILNPFHSNSQIDSSQDQQLPDLVPSDPQESVSVKDSQYLSPRCTNLSSLPYIPSNPPFGTPLGPCPIPFLCPWNGPIQKPVLRKQHLHLSNHYCTSSIVARSVLVRAFIHQSTGMRTHALLPFLYCLCTVCILFSYRFMGALWSSRLSLRIRTPHQRLQLRHSGADPSVTV